MRISILIKILMNWCFFLERRALPSRFAIDFPNHNQLALPRSESWTGSLPSLHSNDPEMPTEYDNTINNSVVSLHSGSLDTDQDTAG